MKKSTGFSRDEDELGTRTALAMAVENGDATTRANVLDARMLAATDPAALLPDAVRSR
jgi:hypothetical protein